MKKILISIFALMLILTSCGEKTEYVATVGKEKITSSEMKFYLESVKGQMAGTELSSDEDWQTKEIEGRKAIDLAKERAMDTAVNNVAYIEVGKALKIQLTAEDKKKVVANKTRFAAQFGGEEKYKEYLKTNNIDDSFIDMLCESMIYSGKLTDKIKSEQPVTEMEVSTYFEENRDDLKTVYRHAKHVLILTKNMDTGVALSPEEQEAAKQKADEIYKRAVAGENFDKLVEEFSQDPGSKTHPNGYVFGEGEMVPEFQNGVDALKPGEISVVKSDIGYHVILRMALEKNDVEDKIKTLMISEKLSQQMGVWEQENNISVTIHDEVVAKTE